MKTKLLAGIFLLLTMISCKKSDNTINPDPGSKHLNMIRTATWKSLIFADDMDSMVFTYNDNNLLVRKDYWLSNASGPSTSLFSYGGSLIVTRDYDDLGNLSATDTMFLNAQGLVARYRGENFTYTVSYKYDSNEYCTEWSHTSSGDTVQKGKNTIYNGNCGKIYDYEPGNGSTTNQITFYSDSLNTVTNLSMGQPYLGKSDVNPKYKNYLLWCTGPIEQESYTYQYDAYGRIIRMDAQTTGPLHDYFTMYTYY